MKISAFYLLAFVCLFINGCLTTGGSQKEYIVGYVVKSAGGISTFREPGFVEQKEPGEGYDESIAVRAVVKITYNKDGTVAELMDLSVSNKSYEARIRDFLYTLRAESASINELNGREHDFRVWIYSGSIVHIEASR